MKKILLVLLIGMFLISLSSATIKEYDDDTDAALFYEGKFVKKDLFADVKLLTPKNNIVGYGSVQEVFRFKVTSYIKSDDLNDIFDDYDWAYYDIKDKDDWEVISKGVELQYKTQAIQNITNYTYTNCDYDEFGDRENCTENIVGYYTKIIDVWNDMDEQNVSMLQGQIMEIRGVTYVNKGEVVEWIPTLFGKEVEEWATWSASLEAGIVSWFKLEETSGDAIDYFGNTSGEATGSPNYQATGIIDDAWEFDGSTDQIDLNNNSDDYDFDGAFAWSFWMYYNNTPNGLNIMIGRNEQYRLELQSAGNWRANVCDTGGCQDGDDRFTAPKPSENTWHHVVFKVSAGENMSLWIDGTLNNSLILDDTRRDYTTINTSIANQYAATTNNFRFDGIMDEIGAWNRDLSAAEISDLYNGGVGIQPTAGAPSLTVEIINPQNQTYAPQTLDLDWTNSSSYNESFYSLNGGTNQSLTQNDTYLSNTYGLNNIRIYVRDDSSGEWATDVQYYTIDTPELIVTLNTPANATNQSSTTPTLTSIVNENRTDISIVNVSYWIDNVLEDTNTSGINGSYSYSPTLVDGDWHTWKVSAWANDSTQYNSTETRYIAWWNNETSIIVNLESPADASTVGSVVNFNSSQTSNRDLVNKTLYWNLSGVWAKNETLSIGLTGSESHGVATEQSNSRSICSGAVITIKNTPLYLSAFERFAGAGTRANNYYVYEGVGSSGTKLGNTTNIASNTVTLDSPILLQAGGVYTICGNATGGGAVDIWRTQNDPVSAPVDDTYITWNRSVASSQYIAEIATINFTQVFNNWTKTIDDSLIWNVQTCTVDNECNFSVANYTLFFDTTPPVVNGLAPNETFAYKNYTDIIASNYTATDTGILDTCWYEFNNTNNTVTCGVNETLSLATGNKNITFYANDTAGNVASDYLTWNYELFLLSESYGAAAVTGADVVLQATLLTNGTGITDANITYNNTEYAGNVYEILSNEKYIVNKTITTPSVQVETNFTFFWNITKADGYNKVLPSRNQTVTSFGVDDCSVYTFVLFNFTMVDEITQTKINPTTQNTTADVDVQILSYPAREIIDDYSKKFTKNNSFSLCTINNLSGGESYLLDLQLQYGASNYASEFYHIQNETITIADFPTPITLYDLSNDNSKNFTITYVDEDFLPIENAIIQIQRKYINEGVFKTIEIPLTSTDGSTVAHLQTEDVIYKFLVLKNGVLLNTFENKFAVCDGSDCSISLNGFASNTLPDDFSSPGNTIFRFTYDNNTREVSTVFSTRSGTSATNKLNVTLVDGLGSTAVCDDTLVTSSGTLTCTVPNAYENSTIFATFTSDGIIQGRATIVQDDDPRGNYGNVQVIIGVFAILMLIGLSITTSPMIMMVMMVVGLLSLFGLNIISKQQAFATSASVLWFIVAIVIIVIKAWRRD